MNISYITISIIYWIELFELNKEFFIFYYLIIIENFYYFFIVSIHMDFVRF